MKKITDIIIHFLDIKFSEEFLSSCNQDELRRIRLVNYLTVITIFNMLLYVVIYSLIDFHLFKPAIANLSIGLFLTIGIIFVNKKGFYNTAKLLLAIFSPLIMTTTSTIIFDQTPGFHVYLLLAGIVPVFMWSFKQRTYIIIFILIYFIIFLFLEFFQSPFHALVDLPENYAFYFKSTNIIVCFMGMGAAIGFYQWFINTKEKQLIQQAEELKISQSHKDIVYSIIAHDLKGPISSFIGLTNYFLKNSDVKNEQFPISIFERMNETSGSLHVLLENLLDWAKMQSGTLIQNRIDFNLKKMVDAILSLYYELYTEKEQEVQVEIDPELKGRADHYMISTVIRNLISNAIKFTSNKGLIKITAITKQDEIEVCVSDTGKGIIEKEIEHIFELKKMTPNVKVSEKGSGLGLLICKDFVQSNDGRIWVESTEGVGSKFYFTFKRAI